jgi:glycosyltransferase involved in cell wall biosynthesis
MKVVIVLPCYNEEEILEKNIRQVAEAVKNLPYDIKIVASDNNSQDKTAEIGKRLALELPNVDYFFVGEPGKGAAVLEAWKQYDADVYGFMDADLATDLDALPEAIQYFKIEEKSLTTSLKLRGAGPTSLLQREEKFLPPLEKEGCLPAVSAGATKPNGFSAVREAGGGFYDIVIGSRRIKGAEVEREPYRKFTSAILNFLIRLLLKTKIKDTPCGFKFFRKAVLEKVLPQVKDRQWVFDTEMLILAERAGFKIKEMPIKWAEKQERGSKVNIYPTAREYLKKIWEIRKMLARG